MSTIRVEAASWGEARIVDVQAVLESVANTLQEHAAIVPEDSILVTQSPVREPSPTLHQAERGSSCFRLWVAGGAS